MCQVVQGFVAKYGDVLRGADHKIEKLATGLLEHFEGSVRVQGVVIQH